MSSSKSLTIPKPIYKMLVPCTDQITEGELRFWSHSALFFEGVVTSLRTFNHATGEIVTMERPSKERDTVVLSSLMVWDFGTKIYRNVSVQWIFTTREDFYKIWRLL